MGALLDDGIIWGVSILVDCTMSMSVVARLIIFGSESAGWGWGCCPSPYCSKFATSDCNCRTVVTIFEAFVVCGGSSSYSTYLTLFLRFSSLYAYFCSRDSDPLSLASVAFYSCVVGCVNYSNLP
jgi:hypothetical protein